jgi:RNA recognition motif-containing protein
MAAANKRSLYVGGLDRQVTEEVLYAAFVPFGPLKSVQVPVDFQTRTSDSRKMHPTDMSTDRWLDV